VIFAASLANKHVNTRNYVAPLICAWFLRPWRNTANCGCKLTCWPNSKIHHRWRSV